MVDINTIKEPLMPVVGVVTDIRHSIIGSPILHRIHHRI